MIDSGDMLPDFTENNSANGGSSQSEFASVAHGILGIVGEKFANLQNIISRNFCLVVGFSALKRLRMNPRTVSISSRGHSKHYFRMLRASGKSFWMSLASVRFRFCLTALKTFVPHIIQLSSEKQMVWIYTRRIVAFMTNLNIFRGTSVNCSPRDSVSLINPSFDLKCRIPVGEFSSRPNPTSRLQLWISNRVRKWPILVDLGPKTNNIFFSHKQALSVPNLLT